MKILIVEDERRVGQFVEKVLAEQNHTVRRVGAIHATASRIGADTLSERIRSRRAKR